MSDNRYQKRKQAAQLEAVIRKAKIDMERWITESGVLPSETEVKAFQAGYIAGINRGSNIK